MSFGFPGLQDLNRKTVRAPVNPMDKSTVISIYPRDIEERKHTIEPGRFLIPAGSYEKPGILVVGSSSWWKDVGEEQPLLEIPTSSVQIADSIVRDWANGLIGCNMADQMPGIFFIPGDISLDSLKKNYRPQLDKAQAAQKKWYQALVKMADVLWSRTNGNPLSISDDMRLAAQELQLKEKPWMQDFTTLELTNCPACGFLRNNNFPVCSNCKTILDTKKFEALGLKMAQ